MSRARIVEAAGTGHRRTLLVKETVLMTVLAQDPSVVDGGGPVRVAIAVPADRLQRGPRGHRFHVVDVNAGSGRAAAPVVLTAEDSWTYRDRWTSAEHPDATTLADSREFRAQNVYAVAAHTLALFEQHLGRPIPWRSGSPQLFLVPQARVERNALYSREHNAVLFGWLPRRTQRPAVFTALSYDIVAHEVSHAVLDGLRPRFTEPGLPDQLAFHEALADLVALLSVFDLDGVAEHLLEPVDGRVRLDPDGQETDSGDQRQALEEERRSRHAEVLKRLPLLRLAEQLGSGAYPALRHSVHLPANSEWKSDPEFAKPHRRAEVLVAAFLQTLVMIWAARLDPLQDNGNGLDASRVAEEGVKAARHLLGMLLRALDYLPPVELEFGDVIDAVITADRRIVPDDDHQYRLALTEAFAAFGVTPPVHHIVDEDGVAAPQPADRPVAVYPPDPDTGSRLGLRYEHLNLVALRTSPEEIYQFIWNNAAVLGIDVRFTTRVERVLASTRVGPDGLIVNEILADYVQTLRTTAGNLPPGMEAPDGMKPDTVVELWGGGVLVFDQFGRFRLHQRQPILDVSRQNRRLQHLFGQGSSSFGAADNGLALLHPLGADPAGTVDLVPSAAGTPPPKWADALSTLAEPGGVGAAEPLLRNLRDKPVATPE